MNIAAGSRDEARINATNTSFARLITIFCFWKALLLLVAAASPGPGYDTSTHLLLFSRQIPDTTTVPSWFEYLVLRLTRWDALYFASASARGPIFEQQWAFSPLLAKVTLWLVGVFFSPERRPGIAAYAFAGIAISHISHLLAVLLLFQLAHEILPASHSRKRQIAFTTACLHITSPAGLFLSAPYGESAFAMANFGGLLCYAKAKRTSQSPESNTAVQAVLWTITSGFLLGVATMIRSNGLFNGIIFAWDAIDCLPGVIGMLQQRNWPALFSLMGTLSAGMLIASGYVLPQIVAYTEYCTDGNERPWCSTALPSIYSFVQSYYWNVGFLRYWTLSNLPLFALATPMILVLIGTAYATLDRRQLVHVMDTISISKRPDSDSAQAQSKALFWNTIPRLALPQLILAGLAITTFHVQIVNRISSGYPVWYLILAIAMHPEPGAGEVRGRSVISLCSRYAEWLVRASVMYAIVQGGLYASFMPPA